MINTNPFRPVWALGLLLCPAAHAAVNDIFPGDYYPAQPGSTTVTLYAFDRDQSGPYRQGAKALDGEIGSSVLALRLSRSFQLGETTMAAVAVLPWSESEVSPAPLAALLGKQAQGAADLRLGVTAWPINDRAGGHYLGITAMAIAPTGDYDANHILNPGENRWRFVLGAGWQREIAPQLLIELDPEAVLYGDNDDYAGGYHMEQHPTYALTGYLRYRVTPVWHLHVGAQVNRGGETRLGGVDQQNPASNDRVMAGMSWYLPGKQQIILRAARDTVIDNGFRTDSEIALRYQKTF